MTEPTIILQGITLTQFREIIREELKAEFKQTDEERLRILSKAEACRMLGISFPTLQKWMKDSEKTQLTTADIEYFKLTKSRYKVA